MPLVYPRLVGDSTSVIALNGEFISVVALNGGFIGGDGPPCTNGVEVTSDEWGPLKVVGALECGNTPNERGSDGGGHFV